MSHLYGLGGEGVVAHLGLSGRQRAHKRGLANVGSPGQHKGVEPRVHDGEAAELLGVVQQPLHRGLLLLVDVLQDRGSFLQRRGGLPRALAPTRPHRVRFPSLQQLLSRRVHPLEHPVVLVLPHRQVEQGTVEGVEPRRCGKPLDVLSEGYRELLGQRVQLHGARGDLFFVFGLDRLRRIHPLDPAQRRRQVLIMRSDLRKGLEPASGAPPLGPTTPGQDRLHTALRFFFFRRSIIFTPHGRRRGVGWAGAGA
mmetsp:Transcript_11805/g.35892  ORF Transcript_11805/g.35892 Transcript_11805/m.35892 type:complete len:253 (-) Transcript_11805:232-990(-)